MRPEKNILTGQPQEMTDDVILALIAAKAKQGKMLSMGSGYYIKIDRYDNEYHVECFSMVTKGPNEGNFEQIFLKEGGQTVFRLFAIEVLRNGKPGLTTLQKITGQMLLAMSRRFDLSNQNRSEKQEMLEKVKLLTRPNKGKDRHCIPDGQQGSELFSNEESGSGPLIPGASSSFPVVKS